MSGGQAQIASLVDGNRFALERPFLTGLWDDTSLPVIGKLGTLGPTLALIPLYIVAIGAVGYPYFRRVLGFDHPTSSEKAKAAKCSRMPCAPSHSRSTRPGE